MTQEEYEEENKRQCLNYLEEIDRLNAQLEQQITRYREVIAEQASISAEHDVRMYAAEAQLSRYQGAVEVDGVVEFYPGTKIAGVFVHQKMPDEMVGRQVRVLVMPKEVE